MTDHCPKDPLGLDSRAERAGSARELRQADAQHSRVHMLEADAPFRDRQPVFRGGDANADVLVRLVRVERPVELGRYYRVFLDPHVVVLAPERPHGVVCHGNTGAPVAGHEGARRTVYQSRDPVAPLTLVMADGPIAQVREKAQSGSAKHEFTAGMPPALVVHEGWREEPDPEHAGLPNVNGECRGRPEIPGGPNNDTPQRGGRMRWVSHCRSVHREMAQHADGPSTTAQGEAPAEPRASTPGRFVRRGCH